MSEGGSSNITVIRRRAPDGHERIFHLIGTAHVSKHSVAEVAEAIDRLRPASVCVELCPTRYAALTDESRWRQLDVRQVIGEGKAPFTLAVLALQAFQRRIGEKMGVRPGAELLAAVEAGRRAGAEIVLADRDVQITLRRAWRNLGMVKRAMLAFALIAGLTGATDVDEADIERLKQKEHISDMLSELAKAMPEVKVPLIDERDAYLMSRVEAAPGDVVVAVVGAGHVAGMVRNLGAAVDRAALEAPAAPRLGARLRPWLAPAGALAAAALGLHRGLDPRRLLIAWAIPTTTGAALGALITGAKPLTTATVALFAPILALWPARAGVWLGRLEAALRRPMPDDGARLGEVVTLRQALRNPMARTLIVSTAAAAGLALGGLVGCGWLAIRVIRG